MTSLSNEDIIKIANSYLLSSPPGEFPEVVADVRALVNNDSLLNSAAQHTFRDYNTSQMVIVTPTGSEHKMLITEYGEVDESHYLDTRGKKLVTFDHFKQEASEVADADASLFPASTEGFRSEMEKVLLEYVEDHYPAGAGAVFAKDSGKMEFSLCISAAKFNPGNFWNGRWRSVWTIAFASGDSSATLSGKFDLDVHYYEDGNVQLKAKQEKTQDIKIEDAAATAKTIIAAITKLEGAYQMAVEEHFNTMSDTTFKQLRRKLPVTKDKINWSKMAGYKLGAEMQSTTK